MRLRPLGSLTMDAILASEQGTEKCPLVPVPGQLWRKIHNRTACIPTPHCSTSSLSIPRPAVKGKLGRGRRSWKASRLAIPVPASACRVLLKFSSDGVAVPGSHSVGKVTICAIFLKADSGKTAVLACHNVGTVTPSPPVASAAPSGGCGEPLHLSARSHSPRDSLAQPHRQPRKPFGCKIHQMKNFS